MPNWRGVKVGDLVAVKFKDHCEQGDEPIEFNLYGRLTKKGTKYITVHCWIYGDDRPRWDENEKYYTIVRAAVTDIVILEGE